MGYKVQIDQLPQMEQGFSAKGWATPYVTHQPFIHTEYNDLKLEETHLGPLDPEIVSLARTIEPGSITDHDNDGYLEVDKETLTYIEFLYDRCVSHPLAPFFHDGIIDNSVADNRFDHLLEIFVGPVVNNDFLGARELFASWVDSYGLNLFDLAIPLAQHLAATAMHVGMNVEDWVTLDSSSGFSVHKSGRLRFDCGLFAQLAHSNLVGISGLTFNYIMMDREDPDMPEATMKGVEIFCFLRDSCDINRTICDTFRISAVYESKKKLPDINKKCNNGEIYWNKGRSPCTVTDAKHTEGWKLIGNMAECGICYPSEMTRYLSVVDGRAAQWAIPLSQLELLKAIYPDTFNKDCPNWEVDYRIFYSGNGVISYPIPKPPNVDDAIHDGHMLLLISDGDQHLIVTNNDVEPIETADPLAFIKNRYSHRYTRFLKRPTFQDEGNTKLF